VSELRMAGHPSSQPIEESATSRRRIESSFGVRADI
jgi:hypothetical protein